MSESRIKTRAEANAQVIANQLGVLRDQLMELRKLVTEIDNATPGSYNARVFIADAEDAIDQSIDGLIDAFGVEK